MTHPTRRNVTTGAFVLATVTATPEVAQAKRPAPEAERIERQGTH